MSTAGMIYIADTLCDGVLLQHASTRMANTSLHVADIQNSFCRDLRRG